MDELVRENGIVDPIDTQDDVAERDRSVSPPESPRPRRALAEKDPAHDPVRSKEWREQKPK